MGEVIRTSCFAEGSAPDTLDETLPFVLNGIKIEVYLQHHSVFGSPGCGHMHSKKDLAFGFPKAFSFPQNRNLTQDKAAETIYVSID